MSSLEPALVECEALGMELVETKTKQFDYFAKEVAIAYHLLKFYCLTNALLMI